MPLNGLKVVVFVSCVIQFNHLWSLNEAGKYGLAPSLLGLRTCLKLSLWID